MRIDTVNPKIWKVNVIGIRTSPLSGKMLPNRQRHSKRRPDKILPYAASAVKENRPRVGPLSTNKVYLCVISISTASAGPQGIGGGDLFIINS